MPTLQRATLLEGFETPQLSTDKLVDDLQTIAKAKSHKAKGNQYASMPVEQRLKLIEQEILKILGRYRGFVKTIRTEKELNEYISKAVAVDYLSLDTETDNSLDPMTCKLMGLCLYVPNTRPVYVPVNHTYPGTDIKLENQLSEEAIARCLDRLNSEKTKIVYHNGKFDIRVCHNTCGVYPSIWWDTMIASQLLDENIPAKLKYQFKLHVDPTIDVYNIESLFTGLPYAWVDPEVFALYAAIDAYDTYKLQQYQQAEFEQQDLARVYKLFKEVEVPIVMVTAHMEDDGINLDLDFLKRLNNKYIQCREECANKLVELCKPYTQQITSLQRKGVLDTPINFDSNDQLKVILYDLMAVPVIDEFGKSTEKDALKAIDNEFTNAILTYRHYSKLVSSFTEPLPNWLSPKDGKLHASFNQMGREERGVRTGRFSSTNPNLQQIPSKEKTMRLAFKASEGNVIVGSDYSAQEPRIMCYLSDEAHLRETFENDRDPYATLVAPAFHMDYWDCMEHYQDGTPNPDGKKMRSKGKVLMLGISYGMGAKLMAKSMGIPMEQCKQVLADFYEQFPKIKEFSEKNEKDAVEKGYVEDYMGRRRHLPNAQLPEIEITQTKSITTNADIFLDMPHGANKVEVPDTQAIKTWMQLWEQSLASNKFKAKQQFKKKASAEGISLKDNGGYISKTKTQCTNARIQGCIGGDSLLLTKEYGISNIESLSNKSITVWDGRDWSGAVVLPSGYKKKCVVTFSNGQQITCSPDHKFGRVSISSKEEKDLIFTPCANLKAGDRIRVSESNFFDTGTYCSIKNDSPTYNAHNYYLDMIENPFYRGVFLGRLASDGSVFDRDNGGKSIRFIVAEHEKDVIDGLLEFIPYKYTVSSALRDGRNETIYYIDIYSKTLVDEIVSLNIKYGIDDRLFKDTAMLRGFLCGMFDGDGTARNGHVYLTFGVQRDFSKYIRDIQKALLFFGVRSRIREYKTCYRVDIYKQDVQKFVERIGFISNEKRLLSKDIAYGKDGHVFKDVVIVSDVTITNDYIDMYDVCDTERGFFVVDGIVTHNSAATLTKKAMVAIFNDKEINDLGFRLLIPVHDELLGECPIENAERVSQRLSELMVSATKPEIPVKFKCDPYIAKHWYADEVEHEIHKEYAQLVKGDTKHSIDPIDGESAIIKLQRKYSEIIPETVRKMCLETFDIINDEV